MGKAFGLLNGVPVVPTSAKTTGASLPFEEVPQGALDGSNTSFTLTYTPNPQYLIILSLNGVLQDRHVPDYTVSGNIITYSIAPKPTDQHFIIYWYIPTSTRGRARQFGSFGVASGVGTFLDESAIGTFAGTTMNDGDTVTVGSITYTFKTTINNSIANEIAANPSGLSLSPTIADLLWSAVTAGHGAGTWYSTPTTANTDVGASSSSPAVIVTALLGTAPDNPITLSSSATARFSWDHTSISNGAMSPGDTLTIGSHTYTFVATINNAVANQVLASPLVTTISSFDGRTYTSSTIVYKVSQMLANAINHAAGSGTMYSSATVVNPDVSAAVNYPPESIKLTAKAAGIAANSISLSTSSGGRFSWGSSTLTGGTGDVTTDVIAWGPDNTNPYHINGDLSIGIWIKLPSDAAGILLISPCLLGHTLTSSNGNAYSLSIHGSAAPWSIRYCHDNAGANANYTNIFATNIASDTWCYVGISRDSVAKTVIMYTAVVGSSVISTVGSFSYPNNPDQTANGHLTIGNGNGGTNPTFDLIPGICTIEEHYIWSRVLSSAEHLTVMQGNPPINSMVLGCYMGDTPEVDISGNGGSGAVTGTTLVQGHD